MFPRTKLPLKRSALLPAEDLKKLSLFWYLVQLHAIRVDSDQRDTFGGEMLAF